ncbi:MAG: preprotein translocase subunit SecG [Anaerolineae bacterium]|nr:preprotein translocase subunit SecG [Anaerolineae bacterium]
MNIAFQIVQIIVAIAIIALVLLQVKGSGLGNIFGGDGGVYRTRRGVEKTLFQATVGLSVFFFIISLVAVTLAG